MAGADDAGENAFHTLAQTVFETRGGAFLVLRACVGAGFAVSAGQKVAMIVDNRHTPRIHIRHGGGDEVLDGLDLSAIEPAARL